MKITFGTFNNAKIQHMQNMLHSLPVKIIGLNTILLSNKPKEAGKFPLENARIKAKHYYSLLKEPVFSCDSGLYIKELNEKNQPGVYIRRINGKELSDNEMVEYYSNLAKINGGSLTAYYKNAICFVINDDYTLESDGRELWSHEFIISCIPHTKRKNGYPLDSLAVNIESNQYYYDIDSSIKEMEDKELENGFTHFFRDALTKIQNLVNIG